MKQTNNIFEIEYRNGFNKKTRLPIINKTKIQISFELNELTNEIYTDTKYGFESHYQNCTAKDPGCKTEHYRLHHSIKPMSVVCFTHLKTGRKFVCKNATGFVCYECDLIEISTNKKVATVYFEDYYKD